MQKYLRELLRDVGLLVASVSTWAIFCAIADLGFSGNLGVRKAFSIVNFIAAASYNLFSLARSMSVIGEAGTPHESLSSLFTEIVNLTQMWGTAFACARYFSLAEGHPFYLQSLTHSTTESIFEMSLVMSGVGWASDAPTTVLERLVAWATAYIGGVLCTNLFLISVVLGRRGYWERPTDTVSMEARPQWTVSLRE